jgi:hypothetical protein
MVPAFEQKLIASGAAGHAGEAAARAESVRPSQRHRARRWRCSHRHAKDAYQNRGETLRDGSQAIAKTMQDNPSSRRQRWIRGAQLRNDFSILALWICNSAMEENAMKKIALITAALAVLATPVLAEDAKTTGAAPADAKFSTVSKDEMFSSKVKGLNVYNQKDESIGEITDLAIKNHQVDALILSVGGFLGMGEHYVAVSPSSVNIRYDSKNDKWLASMSTTKEALKAAPEFKYPK